jgi:hypothetical protein
MYIHAALLWECQLVTLLGILLFKSTVVYSSTFAALLVFCRFCPWTQRLLNQVTNDSAILLRYSNIYLLITAKFFAA